MSQQQEIARVSGRIAPAIVAFLRKRVGRTFYAEELRRHVAEHAFGSSLAAAPASADRILRDLRQRGVVSYDVVSRADSLYLCKAVAR